MTEIKEIKITPPDEEVMRRIRANWDSIAKPIDGLGQLEEMLVRIGGIRGTVNPGLDVPAVVTFCGDHGITAAGVAQTDSSVTRKVAEMIAQNRGVVSHMAAYTGAVSLVVDMGMIGTEPIRDVIPFKIREGTRDFRDEPAMTGQETIEAIEKGMRLAKDLAVRHADLLIPGEMGIGNTTSATALLAAYTGLPVEEITGRGAGLNDEGLERKKQAIREGLDRFGAGGDAMDILANFGGYEIAGMAGLCIGGAVNHVPVLLDGFISSVAGLAADRIVPGVRDYLIASHSSKEPGAKAVMRELGLTPVIYAGCCQGEGTGALLAVPMLQMAGEVYRNMVHFTDTEIKAYQREKTNADTDFRGSGLGEI